MIVKVITGSPADKAGLRAQDRILAVDNRSTAELSTDQAADLLQGAEGSVVELTLQSSGTTLDGKWFAGSMSMFLASTT